jgi:hypothetical protein
VATFVMVVRNMGTGRELVLIKEGPPWLHRFLTIEEGLTTRWPALRGLTQEDCAWRYLLPLASRDGGTWGGHQMEATR